MRSVLVRILGVLVAVGLVVGAIEIRERIDAPTTDGAVPEQPDGDEGTVAPTAANGTILCADAVAAACAAVADVTAGTAWDQARMLISATEPADAGAAAWVVPRPWVDLVREARERTGAAPLLGTPVALARTPVVLVIPDERAAVLESSCGAITWACVGDLAASDWAAAGGDEAWGAPKPAHAPPTDAIGLLVLAQAASHELGTAGFTARDLADDGFRSWFIALERAVPALPAAIDPLEQLLQFGPGRVDVVGTTEATVARLFERAGGRAEGLRVVWPEPVMTVDLVAVPVGDDERATAAAAAVSDTELEGWRLGDGSGALPGAPPLPEDDGMPTGGALEALLLLWQEVVG